MAGTVRRFEAIVAALGVLGAVGGVWWYLQDTKLRDEQWLKEDIEWNAIQIEKLEDIVLRQTVIQTELATQTLRLAAIEGRIKTLAVDHKMVLQSVHQASSGIALSLGRHEGSHEAKE